MKVIKWILISLFIGGLGYLIIGAAVSKPNLIVSQNSEHILVRKYGLYNRDSTMHVYNADKYYDGVVIDKHRRRVRTGNHWRTRYYTKIKYNGTEFNKTGSSYYNTLNIGDKVTVKESWYPIHEITIVK